MSVLFRILSWVGGIVSSIFGLWFSRKMMQKATEQQAGTQAAKSAEEEPKKDTKTAKKS